MVRLMNIRHMNMKMKFIMTSFMMEFVMKMIY